MGSYRSLTIILLFLSSSCSYALPTDAQIARQAIILGNNLLAANPKSFEGERLVQTGLAILPQDEDGLLALALIERGNKPGVIASKIKIGQLATAMIQRADQILDDKDPGRRTRDSEMRLALMFLQAAEPFQPANKDLLIGLKQLEREGYGDQEESQREFGYPQPETARIHPALPYTPPENGPGESGEQPKTGFETAPADAKEFRGHKYKYYGGSITWQEAQEKCESLQGTLVCIGSPDENTFVKELAEGRRVWLGGSDLAQEGKWVWARNGESWTYRNWVKTLTYTSSMSSKKRREYEEAQSDERVVNDESGDFLYMCPNGKWNASDGDGYRILGYICEWQK